jgi:IS4 transposase
MPFRQILDRFIDAAPSRVAVRAILERILTPGKIDDLFRRHVTRQYTRELLFSSIVGLMTPVVLRMRKSINAADTALPQKIGVTLKAVYDKLNRMEPDVSAALVRETAAEMRAAVLEMQGTLPPLLPGRRVLYRDGNCLTGTEHRLLELRDVRAAALPGKTLAILDQETGLVAEIVPCEDGHAQERCLLDRVLDKIQARQVWVADRNFCTNGFLVSLVRGAVHFVIRRHGKLPCREVGRKDRCGKRKDGPRLYEQQGVIWDQNEQPILLRRITVVRTEPTRDGEHEIVILTNPPATEADAAKVAAIYASRWSLETAFQKLTEILRCEVSTLGRPRSALFAFAVAVTSYNVVATLEASLRAIHGADKINDELSMYHLTGEITFHYGGMACIVPPTDWSPLQRMSLPEFAQFLLNVAQRIDISRLKKAKRGPKKPVTPKTRYRNTPHVSTARLLNESH